MRLLSIVTLLALATSARADGIYFTESAGAGHVKDELAASMPDAFVRIRIALGLRHGNWALEGYLAGHIDERAAPASDIGPTTLVAYGADLKYLQPLSEHFAVYLRGSLGRGILQGGPGDYSGRSAGFGAGIQLKGKVRALGFLWWPLFFTGIGPKATAGIFLDDGYDFYRLHEHGDLDHGRAIDAKLTYMTLGFSVGSDF